MVNVATFVCLLAWRMHLRLRREAAAGSRIATDGHLPVQQQHASQAAGNGREVAADVDTLPSSSVSRGTQTEGGPSLTEVRELLQGFRALALTHNLSVRPSVASLALLLHHLELQESAWLQAGPPVMLHAP